MDDAITRIREADEAAEHGALALVLGRFPEYWRSQVDAATRRLRERYTAIGGDGEPPADGGGAVGEPGG